MDKELLKKIKELEKAGFKVKRDIATTKKTFEVPIDLIERFMAIVKHRDLKVKDAIESAINDWVKKHE